MKFLALAILALAPHVLGAGDTPKATEKPQLVPQQDLDNIGLPKGFKIPTEVPENIPLSKLDTLVAGGNVQALVAATSKLLIQKPGPLRPIPKAADELRAVVANYNTLSYCPVHPTASDANPIWTKSVYLEKDNPLAYHVVAVDDLRKNIVVAYRGSMNLEVRGNLMMFSIVPAKTWQADYRKLNKGASAQLGVPGVHQGCFVGYQTVRDALLNRVEQLLKEKPGYSLVVTGYSYGAPLAVYTATDFRLKFPTANTKLVTFGGPRPGDAVYAAMLNFLFKTDTNWDAPVQNVYLRVSNQRDPYPLIPPPTLGFVHGAGQEVFRNEKNEYVLCANKEGFEDARCALSILKENVQQPGDGMALESRHHQYWTYMTCAPGEAYEEGQMIKVDPEAKKKLEGEVFKKFLAVLALTAAPKGKAKSNSGKTAKGNNEWN